MPSTSEDPRRLGGQGVEVPFAAASLLLVDSSSTLHGELAELVAGHVEVFVVTVGANEGLHQVVGHPVEDGFGGNGGIVRLVLAFKGRLDTALEDSARNGRKRHNGGREEDGNGREFHGDDEKSLVIELVLARRGFCLDAKCKL